MSAAILEEACLLKHKKKKKHKTLLYISQHAMLHSVVDMNPESIACIYEILLQCFYTTTSEFKCVVHKNHYTIIGFFFLCCLKLIYHGRYLTKHIYSSNYKHINCINVLWQEYYTMPQFVYMFEYTIHSIKCYKCYNVYMFYIATCYLCLNINYTSSLFYNIYRLVMV